MSATGFTSTGLVELTSGSRTTLERQAFWLRKYPNQTITIEGHCDERGTREYNLALGERRASAARDYLVAIGVDPARVSTISFGKERPVAFGSDEEAGAEPPGRDDLNDPQQGHPDLLKTCRRRSGNGTAPYFAVT